MTAPTTRNLQYAVLETISKTDWALIICFGITIKSITITLFFHLILALILGMRLFKTKTTASTFKNSCVICHIRLYKFKGVTMTCS